MKTLVEWRIQILCSLLPYYHLLMSSIAKVATHLLEVLRRALWVLFFQLKDIHSALKPTAPLQTPAISL